MTLVEIGRVFVRGIYRLAGLDSPYSANGYGPNWSKQRRRALERDDHQCQACGVGKDQLDREPPVHHIRPRRKFDGDWRAMNQLSNLVTLCPKCHARYEGNHTDLAYPQFINEIEAS